MDYKDILKKAEAKNAKLIAVSKTKPIALIEKFYNQGQIDFGENRVPELIEKQAILPKDIKWHMIGSLQSNKLKKIAPWIHLIHSCDRPSIIQAINKEGKKIDRVIPILLQVKIGREEAKKGFSKEDLSAYIISDEFKSLKYISPKGVMGMASFVDNKTIVRSEFKSLKSIYDFLKTKHFKDDNDFRELSMGMSGDFDIALQEGSTMIRVGSAIFGTRN